MLAKTPHYRTVVGLKWARQCPRPACIPRGRSRGVKALGLSFEKKVGEATLRAYPAARRGQWFEYLDVNGPGYCQMDVLFRHESGVWVVLECKLADVEQGQGQLTALYLPILAKLGGSAVGIVVVRHLDRALRLPRVCTTLREAVVIAQRDPATPSVLHWIGKGAL